MAPILTIFGPNRSQRRNLFFEKFSNERRRHRGIVVVVIVAVVVAVVAVVGGFWVACIKGTSLLKVYTQKKSKQGSIQPGLKRSDLCIEKYYNDKKDKHDVVQTNNKDSAISHAQTRSRIQQAI